jgi:hypothetical protein
VPHVKLKIRKPVPDEPLDDGLTIAANRLAAGEIVTAVVQLAALHIEVSPEGESLAVVATIDTGEALMTEFDALAAIELLDKAHEARTGVAKLGLGGIEGIDRIEIVTTEVAGS